MQIPQINRKRRGNINFSAFVKAYKKLPLYTIEIKRYKNILFAFPGKGFSGENYTGIPPYSHEPDGMETTQNFRTFLFMT